MSEIIDLFIERAREVSIAEAAPRLGLVLKGRGTEHAFACPHCGGKDRFALNTAKNKWNCRGGSTGGNDAIGMAAHVQGLDVARRPEFLEACAAVLGEAVPDAGEQISDDRRAEIRAETEARAEQAEREAADRAEAAGEYREKELRKCRGIYAGGKLPVADDAVWRYIMARTGLPSDAVAELGWLHIVDRLTYWHGKDERDNPRDIWCGSAMVLPFIDADGEIIGVHQTWIDMANAPKYRPLLSAHGRIAPAALACTGAPDARRAAVAASADAGRNVSPAGRKGDGPSEPVRGPAGGPAGLAGEAAREVELLPTKKMRGSKKGGLLPVAGEPGAVRWVVGEGIENVAAWFGAELADNIALARASFYAAAGDIGNLAGAAARTGRFGHPHDTRVDTRGRARPVMMPSPDPDPGKLDEGFPLGAHVRELLFLADGDSEPVWTAAHMARAEARARLIAPGIDAGTLWPPRGHDWAEIIVRARLGIAA